MKALQSELEPKVHRADITVLKGKLKGKTEFLMKMPLTDLQMALYAEYVDWMLGVARREEPETSTLWAWLGELRLLCNHPLCFAERLEEKLKAKQELATNTQEHRPFGKKKRKSNSVLDESDLITSGDERTVLAAARGPAVSTTMMDKQLEIIKKLDVPLDSASLALKMQVLEQILEFARKAGDKALVFSHSLRTLTFIASMLRKKHVESIRIDGGVMTSKRQEIVKNFNTGPITVALISTTAGGQGLNMFGANRVIIIDTNYSPQWEEQAVGRAYRMGQKKHVYVYRLTAGGTFEEAMLNQAVFKQQLATRVVDKKNPLRYATKGSKQFLFHPKVLEQRNLDSFIGKDPFVLDKLLNTYSTYVVTISLGSIADRYRNPVFRSIELTETFQEEDTIELTAEQVREANELAAENQLRRRDPAAYQAKIVERQRQKDLELGAYAQSRYASASTQAAQHCGVLNDPASNAHTTYSNGSLGPPVDVGLPPAPQSHVTAFIPTPSGYSEIVPILGANTSHRKTPDPLSERSNVAVPIDHSRRIREAASVSATGLTARPASASRENPTQVPKKLGMLSPLTEAAQTTKRTSSPTVQPAKNYGHTYHSSNNSSSPTPGLPMSGSVPHGQRSQPLNKREDSSDSLFGFPSIDNLLRRGFSRNSRRPQ